MDEEALEAAVDLERRLDGESREDIHFTNLIPLTDSRLRPRRMTIRITLAVKSKDSIQNLPCFNVVFLMSLKFIPITF